ncbi:MAG: hypothetical protein M1834_001604 [Cirrosporium novae-zelandiae]|nr:MAG: hypothetical protein M1834_004121 [Cirrosporium novae-zelandiae]KAI9735588.1 MAG: hypothetical protein M1834_001604 [Cirrosporium novae-zelandiae]
MGVFTLTPIDPSTDFDAIVPMMFEVFAGEGYVQSLCGEPTAENITRSISDMKQALENDPTIKWLKIVDQETGDLVSVAQWFIRPNFVRPQGEVVIKCWPEGSKEQADAKKVIENVHERKWRHVKEGHICLNMMFTNPSYQHQGAGRLMLQWGCTLADHLFLPAWIEASAMGQLLYSKFGFRVVEDAKISQGRFYSEYGLMVRPRKVGVLQGLRKMVMVKVGLEGEAVEAGEKGRGSASGAAGSVAVMKQQQGENRKDVAEVVVLENEIVPEVVSAVV